MTAAALLAAHASAGRAGEAWAAAGVLTTAYAGTEHALPGLAMTARLAAEAGDLASAEEALSGLEAGWPELPASASVLVRRLEEADSLAGGAGGRVGVPAAAIPTAEARTASAGVEVFRLLGARPNPFDAGTTVPFEVTEPSRVRVSVYDVLGREVAVLADGPLAAGNHTRAFDGASLPAGLYAIRAEAGGAVATQRLTLAR